MSMLKPLTPVLYSANAICCSHCDTRQMYNAAVALGWQHDPEGVPYFAFFCPPCARRFEELQTNLEQERRYA